ncbi:MAG: acetylornithine transaminase [Actinobacteria bacterium]|nr:acetylornithine transaminase [Actinomycetota bacterium]
MSCTVHETSADPRVSPDVATLDARYVLPTYARNPLELVSGAGAEVVGADGVQYLDFVTGLSVSNFGHCHPHIVAAIQTQASTLIHCSNLYVTRPQAELASRLSAMANGGRVFFANSGAEANEVAIKVAKKRSGAAAEGGASAVIVTLDRSFHGRTMATLSATGQPEKQAPFAPVLGGFVHVAVGDQAALEAVFRRQKVAAVLMEPVLGESGVVLVREGFLKAAQALCEEHDALFMLDEVQTGLGRCGAPFAYQRFGLSPDVVTVAKTLAGGLPMGAAIVGGRAENVLVAGDHGSTFGGGPVVAAAANAVLDLVEGDGLFHRVEEAGARLEGWLTPLVERGMACEVRRLGLMAAVDLVRVSAKQVVLDALEARILLNATSDVTLRFLPPLNVSDEQIDRVGSFLAARLSAEPPEKGLGPRKGLDE